MLWSFLVFLDRKPAAIFHSVSFAVLLTFEHIVGLLLSHFGGLGSLVHRVKPPDLVYHVKGREGVGKEIGPGRKHVGVGTLRLEVLGR